MRINFYDAALTDTGGTVLVKEKAVNYDAGKMNSPPRSFAYGSNGRRTLFHFGAK